MTFPKYHDLTDDQLQFMGEMKFLIEKWREGGADAIDVINERLNSLEYSLIPYAVKNEPFITSHKLKTYKENPAFAKMLYVDLIPGCKDNQSYFDIGTAVDRRVTYGEIDYDSRFIVKNRPTEELKKSAEENNQIILTESEGKIVDQCVDEYRSRHFFVKRPLKTNFLCLWDKMALKAELDHWDEEQGIFEDVKTCANITTFDPMNYKFQMTFYYFVILKNAERFMSGEDFETFRRKVTGSLNVVDKNSGYSRSHKYVFTNATLQDGIPEMIDLMDKWKDSVESGIWPWKLRLDDMNDLKIFWNSELYPFFDDYKSKIQPTII